MKRTVWRRTTKQLWKISFVRPVSSPIYPTSRCETSMGDKSVETLSNKIEYSSTLVTFSPFPPQQCWLFYFFDCTDHIVYTTLNWGAGGISELTLEANKTEQMLKYRKAPFPKSVSTTFVTLCCLALWPGELRLLIGGSMSTVRDLTNRIPSPRGKRDWHRANNPVLGRKALKPRGIWRRGVKAVRKL